MIGPPPPLAVEALCVRRGALPVLDRLDLRVAAREFLSVVGPSGCGKTTLLETCAGLQPSSSGCVEVFGTAPRPGRRDLALVPARDSLLPWRNALDNAAFGLEVWGVPRADRRERAARMLQQLGLGDRLNAAPATLSQGQRQRVALARAFCLPADLLLLDEPFAALDVLHRLQLGELLLSLLAERGAAALFVTHDLGEAIALADRVLVLSPRPARVVCDLRIGLPRPRRLHALQSDPAFHALYMHLWSALAPPSATGPPDLRDALRDRTRAQGVS